MTSPEVELGPGRWYEAVVVGWSEDEGAGSIAVGPSGVEVFAHFSAIEMSGYRTLAPGEHVRVSLAAYDPPRAPWRAERIVRAQPMQDPPLHGIRVVELGGIGPGPLAAMMLADFGAEVIKVDRPGGEPGRHDHHAVLDRGRRSVAVDLKQAEGVAVVRDLVATAQVLIEGFRPGVAERLGLGPADCLAARPDLVY